MNRLTPNEIKNVTPNIITAPFGIDMVVKGLQAKFSELPWLEKSFARAVTMSTLREDVSRRGVEFDLDYIYPGMFVADGQDYFDMLLNDNVSAYSFFMARDPEETQNYHRGSRVELKRTLSAIFWMNLQLVDNTRKDDFLEELKEEVIDKISNAVYQDNAGNGTVTSVDIIDINDEPRNVFDGFTLDNTETQFLYYPFRGLRFDLDCVFIVNC